MPTQSAPPASGYRLLAAYDAAVGVCGRRSLSLSFSRRPNPSIGAVKLSFRVARFAFVAPVDEADAVLALSPPSVLVVPFDALYPSALGACAACDVCGRAGAWWAVPFGGGVRSGLGLGNDEGGALGDGIGGTGVVIDDRGLSIAAPAVDGRLVGRFSAFSAFSALAGSSGFDFFPSGTGRSTGDIVRE